MLSNIHPAKPNPQIRNNFGVLKDIGFSVLKTTLPPFKSIWLTENKFFDAKGTTKALIEDPNFSRLLTNEEIYLQVSRLKCIDSPV